LGGPQDAFRLAKFERTRDRDSGGSRPPEETDCSRYRHRRSHGEGASHEGGAEDDRCAFPSSAGWPTSSSRCPKCRKAG